MADHSSGTNQRDLLKHRIEDLQCETLSYEKVADMVELFTAGFHASRGLIENASSQLFDSDDPGEFRPFNFKRELALRFLLDRVTYTPLNIVRLIETDPALAAPDTASLHRSVFEGAVNFLYLIQSDVITRFQSYYIMAFQSEKKMYNEVEKWIGHEDAHIREVAKHQLQIPGAPTQTAWSQLLTELEIDDPERIPGYPSIRKRCKEIGPSWDFYYDSKYRGLSAWQHGDPSRSTVSSSRLLQIPEYADRSIFESLIMLAWTWELVHSFISTMYNFCSIPSDPFLMEMDEACMRQAGVTIEKVYSKYHT